MWRLFTDTDLMGTPDLSSFSVCSRKCAPSISPRPSAPFLPLVLSQILSEHPLGLFYRPLQLSHLSRLWNGLRTSFQMTYRTPKLKCEKMIGKHQISLCLTDLRLCQPPASVCLTSFLSPPCEVILLPLFTLHVNFTPKGNQDDGAGQGFRLPRMASGFNGIFVKQRRSAKNGAELDKLPHETLKVESLNLVLKKSAKPERFPFRISSAQLNTS